MPQVSHNNNAHFWREIREIWIVWRSVPNEYKNSQSAHRRKQDKLLPLPHSWRCPADVQKPQQAQQTKTGRKSDGVEDRNSKMDEIPDRSYGKAQILTTTLQSSGPEVNWFFGRTPQNSKRRYRSCHSSDHNAVHIGQKASSFEEIE